MRNINIKISAIVVLLTLLLSSCFDLTETAYSEITEDSFVPTEQDAAALIASAYRQLLCFYDWYGFFDVFEEPGDVIITPTRPNGWDDGGTYRRMHQHTWTNDQGQCEAAYSNCYTGINNSNRVLDQVVAGTLPVGDYTAGVIAELRAIRALWYSILLDTHGNVPLVTTFSDEIPTQATRLEVYNFVVKELTEAIPDLSEANDASTYGRMNKWAAYMTLARVYLNAQVYTGTPQWDKALECADAVINSGKFELSADFSDNFKIANDYTNKECIFAVVYDALHIEDPGFGQFAKWYPPVAKNHFGWSYQTWGGSCANPQFINSYQQGDKRLAKTWLMGPQLAKDGSGDIIWTCENYLPSLTCIKDGVNYTNINYGYRVNKYEQDVESDWYWSNDFPYYRYAETLLIKAECLLRLGKNEQEAADLVSQVRMRDFDDAAQATISVAELKGDTKIKYGTLDWDNNIDVPGDQTPVVLGGLYDEWGWEFACEAQRRTHMIRFGTFSTKNWFNHEAVTDGHTAIFPIPRSAIEANSNLSQNPGY